MVKARIEKDANGVHRIFVQRAKFKHWFELGQHLQTVNAFRKAYSEGKLHWSPEIIDHGSLFQK